MFNVVATHYGERLWCRVQYITFPAYDLRSSVFPNTTCLAACGCRAVSEPYLFRQRDCPQWTSRTALVKQCPCQLACTLDVSPSFESPPPLYLRSWRLGCSTHIPQPYAVTRTKSTLVILTFTWLPTGSIPWQGSGNTAATSYIGNHADPGNLPQ